MSELIYVNENNFYTKYYISKDNRLMCQDKAGDENMILADISNEFDAIFKDGALHFVLQSSAGELLYLKKEDDTWRKFDILKSRRGIKRIQKIKLAKQQNKLCAFYIMEHNGQNLFVKHRFATENLYEEPEVMGTCSDGRTYSICETKFGTVLIFKDTSGIFKKIICDNDFNIKSVEECHFKNEIFAFSTIYYKNKLYALSTVKRKNSTALIFFDTENENDAKIVSFGMPKNCSPEIIASEDGITVLWEENGGIIYSQYIIGNDTFSKPHLWGKGENLVSIRPVHTNYAIFSGKCPFFNFMPQIPGNSLKPGSENNNRRFDMNSAKFETEKIKPKENEFVIQKLTEIEKEVERIGSSLTQMCSFLDKLTEFKENAQKMTADTREDGVFAKITESEATERSIEEINEENMRIFENTDIDSVLPSNDEGR